MTHTNTIQKDTNEMTLADRKNTLNLEVLNNEGKLFWTVPLNLIDVYTSNNDETIYTIHFLDFKNTVKVRKPQYEGQDTDFNFCKTRGMEYDIYVWHMLTFCQMVKEDFKPTKDGWAITDEFVGGNESKETNINNIREVTNV